MDDTTASDTEEEDAEPDEGVDAAVEALWPPTKIRCMHDLGVNGCYRQKPEHLVQFAHRAEHGSLGPEWYTFSTRHL